MHDHERPVFGCQDCIDKGNVGAIEPEDIGRSGWKVWRVEVEKRFRDEFFVLAPNRERAEEDGGELASGYSTVDMMPDDDSVFVTEWKYPLDPKDQVWTGGPDGVMESAVKLGIAR